MDADATDRCTRPTEGQDTVPKLLITSLTVPTGEDPVLTQLRNAGWQIEFSPYRPDRTDTELAEVIRGADAVVAGTDPFTERAFAGADRLKLIARVGVGHDAIHTEAATRRDIAVTITVGVNNDAVADFAMTLIMALGRQLLPNHESVRTGGWKRAIGTDIWGKTIGIIGTGLIGRGVARRAHGFNMRILARDLYPDASIQEQYGARYVELDELLQASDFVTLHVTLNPHTRHMIGARQFALMKPSAYIVNTCRGPVIDEAAMIDALQTGGIAGAGLDVFEREPPVGSPLLTLPNVVLAPHVAGISQESQRGMADMAYAEVLRLARNEPFLHAVNQAGLGQTTR